MAHALIIDDDRNTLDGLADLVAMEGFTTSVAETLAAAREELGKRRPEVVLSDLVLPDGRGTDLLEELAEDEGLEVILITGNASVDTAIEALRLGAYDYLVKPVDVARLKVLLAGVLRTRELKQAVVSLRGELRELGRFGPMIGISAPMRQVYELIEKVAPTSAAVLLIGESGTGKELAAQTVHELSPRHAKAYVPINCGAISPQLIESELFGHERGSFTGASRRHQGHFERADGGTLFLDEITEMPLELQVKLLRVLETGQVLRVGATQPIDVDVRVIAATNRDPERAVEEGRLREDLYYRLQVFPIHLPPLREREGDVELLSAHFLGELNRSQGQNKRLDPKAVSRLESHHWPGNVRELKNVVSRAYILADDVLGPSALPASLGGESQPTGPHLQLRVGISLDDAERRLILATLHQLQGDKKQAAEVLGVSLKTLYNRLNRYQEEEEGKDD